MTKQSSTGAVHTTFHSSSSSSSSESETSSSESSEPNEVVSNKQRNTEANKKSPRNNVAQVPSNASRVTPSSGIRSAVTGIGANVGNRQKPAIAGGSRRGGRKRKKVLSSDLTVGGSRDVLTTVSTLYKSPVQAKPKTDKSSQSNFKETSKSSHTSTNGSETPDAVADRTKKSPAATPTKEKEKPTSQWDVQPQTHIANSSSAVGVSTLKPTVQQLPRDYSTLPNLQGPPRQGDKVAFKVSTSNNNI